jgi:two-component system, NtrC family, response regulator HydG
MELKNATVLIVDDDADVCTAVRLLLKSRAKEVVTERNPENLRSLLSKQNFDIILLDMNFNSSINTGNEGLFWLNKIRMLGSKAGIILITAYGDIDLAVRSLKDGANDFILKPWHNEKLILALKETLNKLETKKGNQTNKEYKSELIGESVSMQSIFKTIEKIAPTDANILILGENGTGKDLIAKAIHEKSLRNKNNFIKVDVGSLTETLFESELFGYKKGAFTDAKEDRIGRFESANRGTLFLDEIGNISLQQQSKLLTVLQNREVTRLGTNQSNPIDIRLLCATNIALTELANENKFRKDLVYRINTITLTAPALRERENDVVLLSQHFVELYRKKYFKTEILLDEKCFSKLKSYTFPGNVRELQYTIERAVIMCEGDTIYPKDLLFSPIENSSQSNNANDALNLSTLEKNTILKVIEMNNGNISKAAKELGITRTALYRRLNKYDI